MSKRGILRRRHKDDQFQSIPSSNKLFDVVDDDEKLTKVNDDELKTAESTKPNAPSILPINSDRQSFVIQDYDSLMIPTTDGDYDLDEIPMKPNNDTLAITEISSPLDEQRRSPMAMTLTSPSLGMSINFI
jgi:hypothetical protein